MAFVRSCRCGGVRHPSGHRGDLARRGSYWLHGCKRRSTGDRSRGGLCLPVLVCASSQRGGLGSPVRTEVRGSDGAHAFRRGRTSHGPQSTTRALKTLALLSSPVELRIQTLHVDLYKVRRRQIVCLDELIQYGDGNRDSVGRCP